MYVELKGYTFAFSKSPVSWVYSLPRQGPANLMSMHIMTQESVVSLKHSLSDIAGQIMVCRRLIHLIIGDSLGKLVIEWTEVRDHSESRQQKKCVKGSGEHC